MRELFSISFIKGTKNQTVITLAKRDIRKNIY